MKKILCILLMALAAAGMTACGTEGEPSPEAEQQPSSQQTAAEDPQPSESGPQSRYLVVYFSYAENADLPEDADVRGLGEHPALERHPHRQYRRGGADDR